MPTYDYRCTECNHEFEYFQSMTSPELEHCPKCNGKVQRLIGAGSGIIFKGSGFYETDYKKKTSCCDTGKSNCSTSSSCSKSDGKAPG